MTPAAEKLKAAEAAWREEQSIKAREKRLAAMQQRAEDRAELKRRTAPTSPASPKHADDLTHAQIWAWGLSHGARWIGKLIVYILAMAIGISVAVLVGICGGSKPRK